MRYPQPYLLFICIVLVFVDVGFAEDKPILILSFFRHGAREVEIPDSPYADYKYIGELTSIGMRQHYLLGQLLRKQYSHLFGETYNEKYIQIYSTDFNRTIESAQAQFQGIYPLGSGVDIPQDFNESLLEPPLKSEQIIPYSNSSALPQQLLSVPIVVTPAQYDYILRPFSPIICPKQINMIKEQQETQDFKDIEKLTYQTRKKLTELIGFSSEDILSLQKSQTVIDNMISMYYQGKPIPYEFNGQFWNETLSLWDIVFMYMRFSSQKQKNIFKTPILNEIINQLNQTILGESTLKAIFYSCHDSTLFNLLNGLNIIDWKCLVDKYKQQDFREFPDNQCPRGPRYASNIIIELYQPQQYYEEYTVRIKYDNHEIYLCDSNMQQQPCKFSQFIKIALQDNVSDFNGECASSQYISLRILHNVISEYISKLDYILLCLLGFSGIVFALLSLKTYKTLRKRIINDNTTLLTQVEI